MRIRLIPRASLDALQELDDLGLGCYVERGRGLIGNEQLGIAGECGGKRHALAHAARKLEGHAVRYIRVGYADFTPGGALTSAAATGRGGKLLPICAASPRYASRI